jgi:hypothetical protein
MTWDGRSVIRVGVCALTVVLAAGQASAQDARLQLPALQGLAEKASETVDITLDAALLQLAAGFLGKDEDAAEIKQVLQDLKGIYVKSYEFDRDGMYAVGDVDGVRKQLAAGNWNRLVDVKSSREASQSEVYVWMDKGVPGGLAILSAEPRQLTIVNIVGRIDLERLRKLEGQFGIPRLDDREPHRKQ